MTGALIQLVAKGVQDIFITRDPQITYFKIVYRRHTNFSLEEIPQYFQHKPDFGKKVTCTISPMGDLMAKTYLVVTLPKIKPFFLDDGTVDPYLKFAWVKKIGFALIKTVEIEIGGQLLDRHYGDWLNIMYELFVKKEDRGMDYMIGNIEKLIDYSSTKDKYTLYIPLQFWFCRNPSLAIPLLCLHHSEVKINLEINDLDKCYLLTPTNYMQLEDNVVPFKFGEYIEQTINGVTASGFFTAFDPVSKRMYYNRISRNKFQSLSTEIISTYTTNDIIRNYSEYLIRSRSTTNFCIPTPGTTTRLYDAVLPNNLVLQECYLLINYVYLDSEERNRFVQSKHEYLIEQLHIYNPQMITSANFNAKADSINPTRFLVWFIQQQYFNDENNNDFFNYTNDYMYIKENGKYNKVGKSLINDESILFNGYERVSYRSYKYYNYLQPLQHFNIGPSEGIQVYSFAMDPDLFQPSGSCNMSYIGNTSIQMNVNYLINDNNPAQFKGYAVGQNILRILDGLGGLVFIR